MSNASAIIRFENVSKAFKGKQILEGFNLDIQTNQKLALKGRSGSGKSTILNLIMAFSEPDSGNIYIDYERPSRQNIKSLRSRICWLPQNTDVLATDEIAIDAILKPFTYAKNKHKIPDKSHIYDLAEKLNLDIQLLKNPFKTLSGGEKQRIGLLLCNLLDTDIILLDEPSSALDKLSTSNAAELLLKDPSKTVISATHDDLWLQYCNNIVEL